MDYHFRHRFYQWLGIVTCLLLSYPVCAQVDTEFWFAAPSLVAEHQPEAVHLVLVAYDEDATVSISQPAASRTLLAARVIPAGGVYSFPISNIPGYRQTVETSAGQVLNNGLLIRSTAKVGAYYTTFAPNAEVYTLKGRHACGTDFVVPMQRRRNCGHNAYCSIEVVATEDNTTVTFSTTVATNLSTTPGIHTITLNRGQSYAIRSAMPNTTAAAHLGGTRVTSDKPICVNTTDDSAAAGADLDLIGEQLVPTSLASDHYIVPTGNSQDDEYAYIYAIDDWVTLMTNDGTGPRQLGVAAPGYPLQVPLTNLSAQYLYSYEGSPFIVFHLTGKINGTELSGTILPALNCSGSQQLTFVPVLSQTEVNVNILTRTENTGSFTINSIYNPTGLQALFHPVPGAPEWSYCSCYNLQLAMGQMGFSISNSEGVFHLGVLDNADNKGAASYGFFSNYGHISVYASASEDYYRVGDQVCLHLAGANQYSHITWWGPDGQVIATDTGDPCISNVSMADAGRYIVSAEHLEGCETYPDTIYVTVFDEVSPNTYTVCEGDSLLLRATADAPYEWYAEDELMEDSTRLVWVRPEQSMTYAVDEYMPGVDMIYWENTSPLQLPTADSSLLWQTSYQHLIVGAEYTWTLHLSAPQNNAVAPKLRLYVNDQLVQMLVVPNGTQGVDYSYTFTAQTASARLRIVAVSPRTNRHLQIDTMTFYPAILVTEEFDVMVTPSFTASIQGPNQLLQGTSATLTAQPEGDAYRWSTGETTQSIDISLPGTYIVNIYRGMCFEQATIYVEGVLPEPQCPEPVWQEPLQVLVCDTMLPFRWRGKYYDLPGTYLDTLHQPLSNGELCDSLYFTLQLDTFHCVLPRRTSLDVQLLTSSATLCDDDIELLLDFQVNDGLADRVVVMLGTDVFMFSLQEEQASISIPIVDYTPGVYSLSVVFEDTYSLLSTAPVVVSLTILYSPLDVFDQLWNNVLAVYAPSSSHALYHEAYVAYQWYRNGEILTGESGSYLHLPDTDFSWGDYYQVQLTREADGRVLMTCPYYPAPYQPQLSAPSAPTAEKILRQGTLFIRRDGSEYSIIGVPLTK